MPQEERGFTMVELIISMAIITIVITFLYTFLDANQRRHRSMQLLAATTQGGRSAFEVLAQDLNQAGFDPAFNTNRTIAANVAPGGSSAVNVTLSGGSSTPITHRIFYGSRLAVGSGCAPTKLATIVDAPPPVGTTPLNATIAGTSTATINPSNTATIAGFSQSTILNTSPIHIVPSYTVGGAASTTGGSTLTVTGTFIPVLLPGETVQVTVSGFVPGHGCDAFNNGGVAWYSTVLSSPAPSATQFAFNVPAAAAWVCTGGTAFGTASGAGITTPNVATVVTTTAHGFLANQPVQISTDVAGLAGIYTVTYPGANCPSGSAQCFSVSSASLPASSTIYTTGAASTATAGGAGRISSTSTVTIVTSSPHGLVNGQSVTVGPPVLPVTDASFDGLATVLSTPATNVFTYSQAGADAVSGNGQTQTYGATRDSSGTVTIFTTAAHGFSVGQSVIVNVTGDTSFSTGNPFTITNVTPISFQYTQTGQPPTNSSGGGTATVGGGAIRASGVVTITTPVSPAAGAQAPYPFVQGQAVVISGVTNPSFNTVPGTPVPIFTVPSASTFTYLQAGPDAVSGNGTAQVGGASRDATGKVEMVTIGAHGFLSGEQVNVTLVPDSSFDTGAGTPAQITATPNATTFTYASSNLTPATSSTGTAQVGGASRSLVNGANTDFIVTTTPNGFSVGQTVNIGSPTSVSNPSFDGTFAIKSILSPTVFSFLDPSGVVNQSSGGGNAAICNYDVQEVVVNNDPKYGRPAITANSVPVVLTTALQAGTPVYSRNYPFSTGILVNNQTAGQGLGFADNKLLFYGDIQNTGDLYYGEYRLQCPGATPGTFVDACAPGCTTPPFTLTRFLTKLALTSTQSAANAGVFAIPPSKATAFDVAQVAPLVTNIQGTCAPAPPPTFAYAAPDETAAGGVTNVTAAVDYTSLATVTPLLNPDGTPVIWFKVNTYGVMDTSVIPAVPYFQTFVMDVRVTLTLQEAQIDPETQTYRLQKLRTHIVPRNINDAWVIAQSGGSSVLPGTPYDPTITYCATGCSLPLP